MTIGVLREAALREAEEIAAMVLLPLPRMLLIPSTPLGADLWGLAVPVVAADLGALLRLPLQPVLLPRQLSHPKLQRNPHGQLPLQPQLLLPPQLRHV